MRKFIERLQFITHDIPHLTHIQQAEKACMAGAKWVQYRCLTKDDPALLADINHIAAVCDDWGATLIVTDHIRFAGKADIQGFHMEDMDADFIALRNLLGDEFTLGGSANTISNLIRLANEGADYAGFGPFAITSTKPNSYPLLSLEDYKNAVNSLHNMQLTLPVMAVGGVILSDAEALRETGIFGVAVSGAINFAADFEEAYRLFYNVFPGCA